jgi:hypothetical protein
MLLHDGKVEGVGGGGGEGVNMFDQLLLFQSCPVARCGRFGLFSSVFPSPGAGSSPFWAEASVR